MDKKRGYVFKNAVSMLMKHLNYTEKEAIDLLEALEGEVKSDRTTEEKEAAITY